MFGSFSHFWKRSCSHREQRDSNRDPLCVLCGVQRLKLLSYLSCQAYVIIS